jgi:RNA polymerase sigma-70 factor (ECF subfamily)
VALGAHDIEAVYRARYANFRNGIAVLTGSPAVAHDAVQDAFAEAIEQRATFRGGSLEAWIWRVAVRSAWRQAGRENAAPSAEWAEVDWPADLTQDHGLLDALRRLSPRRRLVIFLRYYADLSYEEIAVACGISSGTVAATLAQARGELEEALKEPVC